MDQANTQQTADDRQYVDPADLICPGCGEQVRCEPPGYWLATWGCPRPGSHMKTRRPCAWCVPPAGRPSLSRSTGELR